jgi:hypothetical protein
MNAMDDNNDAMFKLADIDRRWRDCERVSWHTPRAVRDWVRFGMMLPQYGDAFERNMINSTMLSVLASPKGKQESQRLFKDVLNITHVPHQTVLIHGVVDCVLAMSGSSVPPPPTHLRVRTPKARASGHAKCDAVLLEWDAPQHVGHHTDPHVYVVYRKCTRCDAWEEVQPTDMTAFDDTVGIKRWGVYSYRVVAWNKVGPSRPIELHDVVVDNAHIHNR